MNRIKKAAIALISIIIFMACFADVSAANASSKIQKIEIDEQIKPDYTIPNQVTWSLLNSLRIYQKDYSDTIKKADVIQEKRTIEEKIVYTVTITAKEDLKGLVLFEYFPEQIARISEIKTESYSEIEANALKIQIGELKKGETINVNFNVNPPAAESDANPSAALTSENRKANLERLRYLSYALFLIFAILVANIHRRYRVMMSYVITSKRHNASETSIKRHMMDSGWNVYVVKRLLAAVRQKTGIQRFGIFWRKNRALIIAAAFAAYVILFWIFDLGRIIFMSENYELYFLAALNAVLIIWIGKIVLDYMNYPKGRTFS